MSLVMITLTNSLITQLHYKTSSLEKEITNYKLSLKTLEKIEYGMNKHYDKIRRHRKTC